MLKRVVCRVVDGFALIFNLGAGAVEIYLLNFIKNDSIWIPLAKHSSMRLAKAVDIGYWSFRLLSKEQYKLLGDRILEYQEKIYAVVQSKGKA